jgi:hypothetical protein
MPRGVSVQETTVSRLHVLQAGLSCYLKLQSSVPKNGQICLMQITENETICTGDKLFRLQTVCHKLRFMKPVIGVISLLSISPANILYSPVCSTWWAQNTTSYSLKTEQSVKDPWTVNGPMGKVIYLKKHSFTKSNCEWKSNTVKRVRVSTGGKLL